MSRRHVGFLIAVVSIVFGPLAAVDAAPATERVIVVLNPDAGPADDPDLVTPGAATGILLARADG